MADDPIQTLVRNKEGKLVPEGPPPVPKAGPAHRRVPRNWGSSWLQEPTYENLIPNAVATLPALLAMITGTVMDDISPKMVGQDVNLPNDTGEVDPRLLGLDAPIPRRRLGKRSGR